MGSFQDLLNRLRGNDIPSQMPGAMGGGFDHGIAGNLSDIQQMPYRYGDQGGIQQMPYRGGTTTLTEFGQGLEALKKAQEGRRDMSTGGLMNEETRRMMNMLQGY